MTLGVRSKPQESNKSGLGLGTMPVYPNEIARILNYLRPYEFDKPAVKRVLRVGGGNLRVAFVETNGGGHEVILYSAQGNAKLLGWVSSDTAPGVDGSVITRSVEGVQVPIKVIPVDEVADFALN